MTKDRALRDRLVKGLGAQGFGQAVNILIQLLTVPLLLATWGVESYGEWLLLAAIPIYLAASDTGFASAAINDMTIAVGRGDNRQMLETFQSIWLFLILVSAVVLSAVAIVVFGFPVGTWLGLSAAGRDAAGLVLILLSAQVLMTQQSTLVYSGFHCVGAYGMGQFLLAATRLTEFAVLALVVFLGGGFVAAAFGLLVGRCIGTVAMRLVLPRFNGGVAFGWRYARRATLKRLLGPAWASMGFTLGDALSVQGFIIVIGMQLGPAATVTFSTLRTMTRFGLQLVLSVNMTVMAEISTAYGAGNRELLRRLHHRSCQLALWLALCVAVGMLVFGDWALGLWTGGRVAMNGPVFLWLMAAVVVQALWQSSMFLEYATNRHQGIAVAYDVVSLVSVAVAAGIVAWSGIVGAAAIVFVLQAVMVVYVLPVSLRNLGESPGHFFRLVIRPPVGFLARAWRVGG